MIELISIYSSAFVVVLLMTPLLSFQGIHLVLRNQSISLLVIAQAAIVGNLFGRILFDHSEAFTLILSLFSIYLIKWISRKKSDQDLLVYYLVLMATSYLMISMFPMLESHFTLGLFGDIVSLSEFECRLLIITSFIFMIYYFFNRRSILKLSLDLVLDGKTIPFISQLIFDIFLVISLYHLGLLFTLSYLIILPVVTSTLFVNHRTQLVSTIVVSAFAGVLGLLTSIMIPRVSTVPSQVIILVLFSFFVLLKNRSSYVKS